MPLSFFVLEGSLSPDHGGRPLPRWDEHAGLPHALTTNPLSLSRVPVTFSRHLPPQKD